MAVTYDDGDMGHLSKHVKHRLRAPHPERCEGQFVDFLLECGGRFRGGLLIPASDETLTTVSRHKNLLERHFIVACTEWEITERFIDKKQTYALAERIGVPAPKTVLPQSVEDVEKYGQAMEYPCLVKPCQGHRYYAAFGEKMVRVDSFDQMLAAYRLAADAGIGVMLQEVIPGDDSQGANYNSYSWNNTPLVEFTAQQLRNAPPELGSPRVVVSRRIAEIVEPGRRILRAMGFYGYSCTEFKRDPRDGIYKLMEVNGRHNRSSLLAVRCGVNFPWLQYKHLVLGEPPTGSDYCTGVYWISLARDAAHSVGSRRLERHSLSDYLRPYLGPHVFAVLDWGDPAPFVQRCIGLARQAFDRGLSALTRRGSRSAQMKGESNEKRCYST